MVYLIEFAKVYFGPHSLGFSSQREPIHSRNTRVQAQDILRLTQCNQLVSYWLILIAYLILKN